MRHLEIGVVRTATLALCAVALALLSGGGAVAQEERGRIPEARFTDAGTEGCMRCHAAENMAVIAQTPHGDATNPHTPAAQAGCESCHGPGSLHMSRARGGAGFPALTRFGRGGDPAADQLEACLGCHAKEMGDDPGMAWSGSLHDTGRMTCSTCHRIHTTEKLLATREQQIDKCGSCHADQLAAHDRFEGKGIVFDRLTCYDCHDVHQLVRRQ